MAEDYLSLLSNYHFIITRHCCIIDIVTDTHNTCSVVVLRVLACVVVVDGCSMKYSNFLISRTFENYFLSLNSLGWSFFVFSFFISLESTMLQQLVNKQGHLHQKNCQLPHRVIPLGKYFLIFRQRACIHIWLCA